MHKYNIYIHKHIDRFFFKRYKKVLTTIFTMLHVLKLQMHYFWYQNSISHLNNSLSTNHQSSFRMCNTKYINNKLNI